MQGAATQYQAGRAPLIPGEQVPKLLVLLLLLLMMMMRVVLLLLTLRLLPTVELLLLLLGMALQSDQRDYRLQIAPPWSLGRSTPVLPLAHDQSDQAEPGTPVR